MCEERGGPERRVFDIIGSDYYADFRIYDLYKGHWSLVGRWRALQCANGLSAFLNIHFPAKCRVQRDFFDGNLFSCISWHVGHLSH